MNRRRILLRLVFHANPHLSPVALPLPSSPCLAKVNDRQKGCANSEPDKRYANEAVLQAQGVDPRCDRVSNSEAHSIANNDDRRQGVTGNAVEGIDEIRDGESDAAGRTDSEAHHCEDETEPMNLVCGLRVVSIVANISRREYLRLHPTG